jgi:Ribbon-helix-helix domain
MKRTNIYLLPRQVKRLEDESKKTGAPVAELVRRAIDNTYPVEKAKAKAAAR